MTRVTIEFYIPNSTALDDGQYESVIRSFCSRAFRGLEHRGPRRTFLLDPEKQHVAGFLEVRLAEPMHIL
jgi:hypothetical protein